MTNKWEFKQRNGPKLQAEMEAIEIGIEGAKKSGDIGQGKYWHRRYTDSVSTNKLQTNIGRRQKALLIGARNRHVTASLQNAYASKSHGNMLHVFCVSSTMYDKWSARGDGFMVDVSGIPKLRRFCGVITAHAKFLEAQYSLRSRLPSLLNSLELWANNPSREEVIDSPLRDLSIKQTFTDMRSRVSNIQNALDSNVDLIRSDSRSSTPNSLFKPSARKVFSNINVGLQFIQKSSGHSMNCYIGLRMDYWQKQAEAEGRKWFPTAWHWSTY